MPRPVPLTALGLLRVTARGSRTGPTLCGMITQAVPAGRRVNGSRRWPAPIVPRLAPPDLTVLAR
jgi:hypothetical protein